MYWEGFGAARGSSAMGSLDGEENVFTQWTVPSLQ